MLTETEVIADAKKRLGPYFDQVSITYDMVTLTIEADSHLIQKIKEHLMIYQSTLPYTLAFKIVRSPHKLIVSLEQVEVCSYMYTKSTGYVDRDNRKIGEWVYIGADNTKLVCNYNQDVLNGLWSLYGPRGDLQSQCNFSDGKPHGEYTNYINNRPIEIQDMVHGVCHGRYRRFFESIPEKVEIEGRFDDDHCDGCWKTFSIDDIVLNEKYYKKDVKVGHWKYYTDKGDLREENIYHNE